MQNPVKEIKARIGGGELKRYPGSDWRKAFTYYLDNVWSERDHIVDAIIIIDQVVLCLNKQEYSLTNPTEKDNPERPQLSRDEIMARPADRNSLELGLVKFMRNNSIRQLVIEFGDNRFMLWKGETRPELYMTVTDRTF